MLGADFQVQTDAAGSLGYDLYFRGCWCVGRWPVSWQTLGITRDLTFLELFPIVDAVWLWAEAWANSVVTFWCDNQAVVQIVHPLMYRCQRIMDLARAFTLCCNLT